MFGYWWRVLRRAVGDTCSCLNIKPRKALAGYAGLIIAAASYGLWKGTEEGLAKLVWPILVILSGLPVLIITFLWQFLAAPFRMEQDTVSATKKLYDEWEARHADQERKLSDLQASHADLRRDLEREKHSDPTRNRQRLDVQGFLAKFEALEKLVATGDLQACRQVYLEEWPVHKYLERELSYKQFNVDHPVRNSWPGDFKIDLEHVLVRCQARIERLREVLEKILQADPPSA